MSRVGKVSKSNYILAVEGKIYLRRKLKPIGENKMTIILKPTRKLLSASALGIALTFGTLGGASLLATTAIAQVSVSAMPSSFADLVEAVKPAVVSIQVEGKQQVTRFNRPNGFNFDFPDLPEDHPFRRFFEEFGTPNQPQAPKERTFRAAGSGFVISQDGYIVTNNHVVDMADKVTVIFDNGDELEATIIGTDERTDLALLKVKSKEDLPFVKFADDEGRIGDWVVAVGNPFGLGSSVTAGIISGRGRDIGGNSYGDFLQIDAAINRGNSGGPAFNLSGEVVGVNTAIFSPNGGNVGIAFAIPSSIAKQIVNDLRDDGDVTRGFLGVSIQDVTRDIANSVGLPTARGALVTQLTDGAPAASAGIKAGDIIVEVNGQPIDDAKDLSRTVGSIAPEEKVNIKIWRQGKNIKLKVKLATLDEDMLKAPIPQKEIPQEPLEPQTSSIGLIVMPQDDGAGLVVEGVKEDSTAAAKGFMAGDIILEVDNLPVSNIQELETILEDVKASGRETVLIKVDRQGNIRFIGLPLSE